MNYNDFNKLTIWQLIKINPKKLNKPQKFDKYELIFFICFLSFLLILLINNYLSLK